MRPVPIAVVGNAHEFGQFIDLAISAPDAYDSYPTITPDDGYLLFGSRRST